MSKLPAMVLKGRRGRVCAASKLPGHLAGCLPSEAMLPPPLPGSEPMFSEGRCYACDQVFLLVLTCWRIQGCCPECAAVYVADPPGGGVPAPPETVALEAVAIAFLNFRQEYSSDPGSTQGVRDFAEWFYARRYKPTRGRLQEALTTRFEASQSNSHMGFFLMMGSSVPAALELTMLAMTKRSAAPSVAGRCSFLTILCGALLAEGHDIRRIRTSNLEDVEMRFRKQVPTHLFDYWTEHDA
jgi:hypothetical protein